MRHEIPPFHIKEKLIQAKETIENVATMKRNRLAETKSRAKKAFMMVLLPA